MEICPADVMALDAAAGGVARNREPDLCWDCFACVKSCPQSAIAVRGAADVMPLGARITPARGTAGISWRIEFRDRSVRTFQFPIRTTAWGSIAPFAAVAPPAVDELKTSRLCGEIPVPGAVDVS